MERENKLDFVNKPSSRSQSEGKPIILLINDRCSKSRKETTLFWSMQQTLYGCHEIERHPSCFAVELNLLYLYNVHEP